MYRPPSSLADFNHLQNDIDILDEWTENQYLTFNPKKCKAMVLSRKRYTVLPTNPLLLKGQALEFVDSIKYLCLTISSELSWSRHIEQISSKARKLVGMLFRQFYNYTDKQTIKTLYLSIVRPHLKYACQVWDPYLEKDKNTLEKVQKFACKVCCKSWDAEYENLLEELRFPTLETRRTHLKLCTFYNFVHSHSVPPFIINYRSPNDYSIRSHHNLAITQPHAHTNQNCTLFFPALSLYETNYRKRLLMPPLFTCLKTLSHHTFIPHPFDIIITVFIAVCIYAGCTHVLASLCYLCILCLLSIKVIEKKTPALK